MFFAIPPATRALILLNVVVFLLELVDGGALIEWFALWPLGGGPAPSFAPWQLVTYSFLHGGLAHIFFNMFALFMFGSDIERVYGTRWFALFYFVSVVTAGFAQLIFAAFSGGPAYPTIGASGGVFGVLLAFGMTFPRRMVVLIFPPIPMPAWLFVTLYGVLELYLGVTGTAAGIAHFAHLGGMLGGWLMIRQRRRQPPFGPRR